MKHILDIQDVGFAPSRRDVREIAYNMAELLGLKTTFNKEEKMAGKVWLSSFLRRNPELTVRKSEGCSRPRTEGMNKTEVSNYFNLLQKVLAENNLLDKPGNIWNADETGVQMNNVAGEVIARKGSKDVKVVTTSEKCEIITILACCNAEGHFLPPYCIMKGVYSKPEFERGAPPGTLIKMRSETAYMNSDLFMDWLLNHFIPRKRTGKNLLILDCHASHMNNASLLEIARDNDIVIVCLPSHTTHYLQPLDRVAFKPFKTYWKDACQKLVRQNNGIKNISRSQFGGLLNSAWIRFANVQIGVSAFRATGICPLNMDAIPNYAYLLSCDQGKSYPDSTVPGTPTSFNQTNPNSPQSTSSTSIISPNPPPTPTSDACQNSSQQNTQLTPSKALRATWPIPSSLKPSSSKRKQSATNITDPDYIERQKDKEEERKKKNTKRSTGKMSKKTKNNGHELTNKIKRAKRKLELQSSSDEDTDEELVLFSDDESDEFDEDQCVECLKLYTETHSKSDWFQCVVCKRWLHESCSIYGNMCALCGRNSNKPQRKLQNTKKVK